MMQVATAIPSNVCVPRAGVLSQYSRAYVNYKEKAQEFEFLGFLIGSSQVFIHNTLFRHYHKDARHRYKRWCPYPQYNNPSHQKSKGIGPRNKQLRLLLDYC